MGDGSKLNNKHIEVILIVIYNRDRMYFEVNRTMSDEVKYVADIPKLLAEWDHEKNGDIISPYKLTVGSNKKVYWKCEQGHTWQEPIYKRTKGKSCPFCANKRVWIGYNDLSTLYPRLVDEWNDAENGGVDVNTLVPGSTQKVSWKCKKCGFVWEAKVCARTMRGSGCPECAKKERGKSRSRYSVEKNGALSDARLLESWDYEKNFPLRPKDVSSHSNKKVWWKCPVCGYSWEAKICNRSNGRDCPCCSNRVLVKGVNDLATCNPKLAAEWDMERNAPTTPSDVFPKSGKKYHWICPQGHRYSATVLHRAGGTNCPHCNSGRQTSFAEQAVFYYIKQIFPDAVGRYKDIFDNGMELDIYIPSIRTAIEYDGVFWHKKEKRKREMKKYEICQRNRIKLIRIREAKDCTWGIADEAYHKDDLDDRKNLEMLIRHIMDRLDPRSNMWTRRRPIFHSPLSIDLERDENEIRKYMTIVKDSLQDMRADIAGEWHPAKNGDLKPNMFKCGSDYKAWWQCPVCGHEWRTSIGCRVGGTGCPECYRRSRKGRHPRARKIYQFSKDDTLIKEWNSIMEAGRTLSISTGNIGMCLKGIRRYAGGFAWKDKLDSE